MKRSRPLLTRLAGLAAGLVLALTPSLARDPAPTSGGATPTAEAPAADAPPATKKARVKSPQELTIAMLGVGTGLVATVLGIGIGMLAIWTDFQKRRTLVECCHRERIAALEKGLEVPPYPPGILGPGASLDPGPPGTCLLPALVWLGVGAALWFILPAEGRWFYQRPMAGLPAFIGFACLAYYFVEGRRNAPPASPAADRNRP